MTDLIPVGTTVRLTPEAYAYWTEGFEEMDDKYNNPLDMDGVVMENQFPKIDRSSLFQDFVYRVRWANGSTNSYYIDQIVVKENANA